MPEPSDYDRLMRGVIPYLTIDGVDQAIEFYQRALGAVLHGDVTRAPDSGKVLNALLEINGGAVMLVDYFSQMPEGPAKAGNGFMMQLVSTQGQKLWDQAIANGCTIVTPFETQFWGDTWGQFTDPFGIGWAVNQPSQANRERAGVYPDKDTK